VKKVYFFIFFVLNFEIILFAEPPHLGYIYPAGAKKGTTVTVTIGGQYLKKATEVYISDKNIKATILKYIESPVKELELCQARYYFELEKYATAKPDENGVLILKDKALGRVWSFFELQKLAAKINSLEKIVYDPKRQPNAQLDEKLTVLIVIPKSVKPGNYELRILTPDGLSNPVIFNVDSFCEIQEEWRFRPKEIFSFPVVINGQCMPGDRDRYRFFAKKGENFVFAVKARSLNPYFADTVPGWFQATIAIYDEKENELEFEDDFFYDPDPVLFFKVPYDGFYLLEIRDALWRGREDFVYRVVAGKIPYILSTFPLGGKRNKIRNVELKGYNLSVNQKKIKIKNKTGIVNLSEENVFKIPSRELFYLVTDFTDIMEKELNNNYENAQKLTLPVAVDGKLSSKEDVDIFYFDAKKDDRISIEVFARRLGSPIDSFLRIKKEDGTVIAENDDSVDITSGLVTHHADSVINNLMIPSDGRYFVELFDNQNIGNDLSSYRMIVNKSIPNFTLLVEPSAINIPKGGNAKITVYAVRKDGFNNKIRVLTDMSNLLKIKPAIIPEDSTILNCTVTASKKIDTGIYLCNFYGESIVDDKPVRHKAFSVDKLMQAFSWTQLVKRKESIIAITKPLLLDIRPVDTIIKIPSGGEAILKLYEFNGNYIPKDMIMTLAVPLEGITIKKTELKDSRTVLLYLFAEKEKCKPGKKGTIIISTQTGYNQKSFYSILPAVQFEIIEDK